jgi:hypothetical protein
MLSLALTGCPEMHRPGGIIDKAAHKDALESIPGRCSDQDHAKYCGNGKKDTEECISRCGG